MELMETAQELPQIAIGAAQMETLYGSIVEYDFRRSL